MIYLLSALCAFLYYLGGEGGYWYRDLEFRRAGCAITMVSALWMGHGSNWALLITALGIYGGMTLGDFGKFYWTPQAAAVALACVPYAIRSGRTWQECLILAIVPVLVYIVSRFCQPIDSWLRGAVYGLIPLIFFWM